MTPGPEDRPAPGARFARFEARRAAVLDFIASIPGADFFTARPIPGSDAVEVEGFAQDPELLRRSIYEAYGDDVRVSVVGLKRAERRVAPLRRVAVDFAGVLRAERGELAWGTAVDAAGGLGRGALKSRAELDHEAQIADAAMAASASYLAAHREVFGGATIYSDERGVHFSASFTDDLSRHRDALGSDVLVYRAQNTLDQLRAIYNEVVAFVDGHRQLIDPEVALSVFGNQVELQAKMADDRAIRQELDDRFGDAVVLDWRGPRATEGLALD